jgi:hypothetical protein
MTGSARRARRPLRRLGRLLLGQNELRRPSDRSEAAVIVSLVAAFLTAAAAAGCLAWHLHQHEHAVAAPLRPTVAALSQPAGAASSRTIAAAAR